MGSRKLVYKNDAVSLGGLNGFLYTYEYEGQDYQEIRKHMVMKVRSGDYEFTLDYDDLTEDFERNLPTIQKMLDSFEFKGETSEESKISDYGNLGFTFSDIQYHRFALAIGELAEKEIVSGYSDGTFRPEQLVSRAEAPKMILESKNHLETEKGLGNEIDFEAYQDRDSDLWDVKASQWFHKYVQYATEKEIVEGYRDGSFRPQQLVTLAESLKMILQVYKIPLWEGQTDPWFKKYMEKSFELRLTPYGMYDPNLKLTRAELAQLVNTIYEQAKN